MPPIRLLPGQITRWLVTLAAALLASVAASNASADGQDILPIGVSLALEHARIPVSAVAILVQPVDSAQPSLSVNADTPMNPAFDSSPSRRCARASLWTRLRYR